jgi:hypothetical protein
MPDGWVRFGPAYHKAAIVAVQDGPPVRRPEENEILWENGICPAHNTQARIYFRDSTSKWVESVDLVKNSCSQQIAT